MGLNKTVFTLVTVAALIFALSIGMRVYEKHTNQMGRFADDAAKYSNMGGDFTLDSIDGPVSMSSLTARGVVVLHFGFTRCPDICPATLANLAAALGQLNDEERKRVIPVMISADPEYDTLERLVQYARFFVPEITALRGSLEQTHAVARQYGAYFNKVPIEGSELGYTVDHTTRLYIVTKEGIQTVLDHNMASDAMAEVLRIFARDS